MKDQCEYKEAKLFFIEEEEQKFIEYLNQLRAINPDRKIVLFMDNLRVHKTKRVQEHMDNLNYRYVYNVPYSPQYAGIEYLFSKMRLYYRKKKLNLVINETNHHTTDLIREAFS